MHTTIALPASAPRRASQWETMSAATSLMRSDAPTTAPRAPKGLNPAGRRLWRAILCDFDLDEHQLAVLGVACRTVDRLEDVAIRFGATGVEDQVASGYELCGREGARDHLERRGRREAVRRLARRNEEFDISAPNPSLDGAKDCLG